MTDHESIYEKLSEIRSDITRINTNVDWIVKRHETVCSDVEDLKKYRWTTYGIIIAVNVAIGVLSVYIWH